MIVLSLFLTMPVVFRWWRYEHIEPFVKRVILLSLFIRKQMKSFPAILKNELRLNPAGSIILLSLLHGHFYVPVELSDCIIKTNIAECFLVC